jgi:hypothetical protein
MATRGRYGAWLGLAGVAPDEPARARRVSEWVEWVLVPLALWLPIQWSLESSGQISAPTANLVAWLTWALFVAGRPWSGHWSTTVPVISAATG